MYVIPLQNPLTIQFIHSDQKSYIICDKEKYTVGRANSDIIINDDKSMSREHAALFPKPGQLNVEDYSKYGVFVNDGIETNKGIEKGGQTELKAGNIVRFGRFDSIWRVERVEWTIVPSTLTEDEKNTIKAYLGVLDGQYSNEWSDACTHLVMSDVTITIKVLLALAKGIPIVLPDFLNKTIAAIKEKRTAMPNETDFIPNICEPYLMQDKSLLAVNFDRCRLFAGKVFYFMKESQQRDYEAAIKMAGGTCHNLQTDKIRKPLLVNSDAVLVKYMAEGQSQQATQTLEAVEQYASKNNRRMVTESEIGLALFHCSIAQFCNPNYKIENNFKMPENSSFDKAGLLMADETPQVAAVSQPHVETLEVAETINIDDDDGDINEANGESQAQPAVSVPVTDSNISAEVESTRSSARASTRSSTRRSKDNQILVSPPAKPTSRSTTNENKRKAAAISPALSKRVKATDAFDLLSKPDVVVPQAIIVQALELTKPVGGPPKTSVPKKSPARPAAPVPASLDPFEPSQNSPAPQSSPAPSLFGQDTQPFVPNASGFLSAHNSSILRRRQDNTPRDTATPPKPVVNKRPFESLNDDDDADLFQFETKSMSKKSKRDRGGGRTAAAENNRGDDDLFNFGNVLSSSGRGSQRQRKRPAEGESRQQAEQVRPNTMSIIEQREADFAKKASYLKPVPVSNIGWICKQLKKDMKLGDDDEAAVKIKEEPLSDSQLTKDERNRRWENSLENAIIVQTLDMSLIKPMGSGGAANRCLRWLKHIKWPQKF